MSAENGPLTGDWRALTPFLTGYVRTAAGPGETAAQLAARVGHGAQPEAVLAANPALQDGRAAAGQALTVPLGFEVVPDCVRFTSVVMELCVDGLLARYPFLHAGRVGTSVLGRPIHRLRLGAGEPQVLYNGAHHANEWITAPLLLRFLERYAAACANGGKIFDIDALTLYSKITLNMVPLVNPDGVDLVTGLTSGGPVYRRAAALSAACPEVPFPSGWKANIRGVDLNLQYPAGWENAVVIKKEKGIRGPGPRDFAGPGPLSEPESRALYDLTLSQEYALTLSYHTQGRVIYWKYLEFERKIHTRRHRNSPRSGYAVEETPTCRDMPVTRTGSYPALPAGLHLESREGTSPLPLSQFSGIYGENLALCAGLQIAESFNSVHKNKGVTVMRVQFAMMSKASENFTKIP